MLISLIEGLLCKEPKKRLNVKQAMNHPFFTDFEWDKISKKCIKSPILIDEFQNSNESSPKLSPDSNPGNIFKNLSEFSFDYELKTEGLDK